jgi:hypothetical protein
MFDEFIHFLKGAVVEEKFDAFADGEFAFAVLAFAARGSPALFGCDVTAPEFFEAVHSVEGLH